MIEDSTIWAMNMPWTGNVKSPWKPGGASIIIFECEFRTRSPKSSNQTMSHSHWMFFKYEYKTRNRKFYEHMAVRFVWVMVMVFNVTFNNISVISWRSVLLVEDTRVSGENHRLVSSH